MNEIVKIHFELEVDEDGYPPVQHESLHAVKVNGNLFRLDNTPFFVYDIELGAIVFAEEIQGFPNQYKFLEVENYTGGQSISIIFLEEKIVSDVILYLGGRGCYYEYGEFNEGSLKMLAVNVAPECDYTSIYNYLYKKELEDLLSFSELCLSETVLRAREKD